MFEKIFLAVTAVSVSAFCTVVVLAALGILRDAGVIQACNNKCSNSSDVEMCTTACKDPEYAAKHK